MLAEAVQTVMRAHRVPDSYEKLKELTRGKGGITRFTEFNASVVGGAAGTSIRNIVARSGTMSVRGDLRVADKALTGALSVDIATQRDMRPFTVKLSGTPVAPVFSGN